MPLNPAPLHGLSSKGSRLRLSSPVRRIVVEGVTLGLLLLALGVIYRQVVLGRVLAGGDLHLYFYPYWMAATRAFHAEGSLLWNPYLFAGAPLLANSQVGALYPLNWPFWWLSSPALGHVARALHGSVLLHLSLAALNAYVLTRLWSNKWMPLVAESFAGARATGCTSAAAALRIGAVMAGLIYAGSGFLAVHMEHLNQLQAWAWLPLCFLPGQPVLAAGGDPLPGGRTRPLAIVAFAMILLAGHTQMAFIAALGMAIWYGVEVLEALPALHAGFPTGEGQAPIRGWWRRVAVAMGRGWVGRLAPFALAGVLAGAQLVPTMELARMSGRSADYAWREAVSFSLPPWQLPRALLPPYFTAPLLPEGVAYIGLLGLLLAGIGVWGVLRLRTGFSPAVLALAGVFLALGGYNPFYLALVRLRVPGFAHFRAPARFLGLYVLGAAVLAGLGTTTLLRARKRVLAGVVAGLVFLVAVLELSYGGHSLPMHAATTLRAYTDLRPATAHLVAVAQSERPTDLAGHRFLSISQTLFEVGDKEELIGIYGDLLPADAVWAYMVASKQREVLAPNLSLAFHVPAVDGYDGGVLPLDSYTTFSRLLLSEGTPDGRLRENLAAIPESRWLNLLGVRHLVTDKTGDVWIQDVLYDRQFRPVLAANETLRVAWLPHEFAANELHLLYTGVGEVMIQLLDGREVQAVLPESTELDAVWRSGWEGATQVVGLEVRARGGALMLSGASLVDERLGSFYPLVLSDAFRLVHSGDVKIYEMLSPPPRAFLVHAADRVTSAAEALEAMAAEDFDPLDRVILIDGTGGTLNPASSAPHSAPLRVQDGRVHVVDYDATRVTIDVETAHAGYLVLTDAWYPGWTAWVTAQPDAEGALSSRPDAASRINTPVMQADLLFRAVPVAPGRWRVTLIYTPWILYAGLGLSLLGLVALGAYAFAVSQHLGTLIKFLRPTQR
jgi:hypothetical protein